MDPETPVEQAPEASVEDRIGALFGDAPAAEEPAPDASAQSPEAASEEVATDPPAPETFELEVDGEKFVLPKKLEKGFLQEKDYTQKSQTLAEQRRSLEMAQRQQRIAAMSTDFHKEVAPDLQQLQMIDWAVSQKIDWNSMSTDEAFRKKLEIDSLKDEKSRLEKQIEGKKSEWGNKQAQEIAKLRTESLETIKKRLPGWTDTSAKELRQFGLSEGMTEEELNSILDPRHVSILWKAQQYEKLKANATPVAAAAKNLKTTPTNPMPQHVKDKLAFRKEIGKHAQGSAQQQQVVRDRIAKIFG
jgi:predicted Rdx family selenoprotein